MIMSYALIRLRIPPPEAIFSRNLSSHASYSSPYVPSCYISFLDRCTTLQQLKLIQAPLTSSGLHSNPFLIGKLVETLTIRLCNHQSSLPHAMLLLSHAHQPPNLFAWNTLIRGLSLSPTPQHALRLFAAMLQTPSVAPDSYSYAFALKACARLRAHGATKAIHGLLVMSGNLSGNHGTNTLLHAYASCGDMASARKVFDAVPSDDAIAWNAMLTGYLRNGLPKVALKLLHQMRTADVLPTDVTMITALSACSQMKELSLGMQIHGCIKKRAMLIDEEINLGTALIDMYATCRFLRPAEQVFEEMRSKDIGVWNALLGGYVHNGCFDKALKFYDALQASALQPDGPTLVHALSACGNAGRLDIGKTIHQYIEERFGCADAILDTSLMEMYARCGCVESSLEVFNKMTKKDSMAWSSMIRSLAVHGHGNKALELFGLMQGSGVKADDVTFVGVLCACSHAGLVEEGLSYFKSMSRDHGIVPRVEHYGCMIDLLSRAGRLREALELISTMDSNANAVIWRSFLSACRLNLDVELAEIAVANLKKLRSEHCGDFVLLSNIYTEKGLWDDARRVRKQMKEMDIRKNPAFSLV